MKSRETKNQFVCPYAIHTNIKIEKMICEINIYLFGKNILMFAFGCKWGKKLYKIKANWFYAQFYVKIVEYFGNYTRTIRWIAGSHLICIN